MANQDAERKTMLIKAGTQTPGKCSACLKPIIWVVTRRGARMPMDDGFEIAGYEPVGDVTMMRVFCDQSHFATCAFAGRFRRGRAA